MGQLSSTIVSRTQALTSRITPDRRRHKRVVITLLGRFMRANRQEYPCKLIDISVGGAAMMSPTAVEMGERIVAYFDQIGGLEGRVVRQFEGGFALQFSATQHRREKLAAQLTWLVNRHEMNGFAERRHERVVPKNSSSSLKIGDEMPVACQILNVSISGAAIATEMRPAFGTEVLIGKLRGRVVRHHEQGIGVEFLDIQAPTALRRHFG